VRNVLLGRRRLRQGQAPVRRGRSPHLAILVWGAAGFTIVQRTSRNQACCGWPGATARKPVRAADGAVRRRRPAGVLPPAPRHAAGGEAVARGVPVAARVVVSLALRRPGRPGLRRASQPRMSRPALDYGAGASPVRGQRGPPPPVRAHSRSALRNPAGRGPAAASVGITSPASAAAPRHRTGGALVPRHYISYERCSATPSYRR